MDPISEDEYTKELASVLIQERTTVPMHIKDGLVVAQMNDYDDAFANALTNFMAEYYSNVLDSAIAEAARDLFKFLHDQIAPNIEANARVDAQASWDKLQSFRPDADAREGV